LPTIYLREECLIFQQPAREIRPRDRVFLQQWAEKLDVSIDVLLKRILLAAIEDQLYAEKIPEI
jgi:hypothetical protein